MSFTGFEPNSGDARPTIIVTPETLSTPSTTDSGQTSSWLGRKISHLKDVVANFLKDNKSILYQTAGGILIGSGIVMVVAAGVCFLSWPVIFIFIAPIPMAIGLIGVSAAILSVAIAPLMIGVCFMEQAARG